MSELEDLEAALLGEYKIRVRITQAHPSCQQCASFVGHVGIYDGKIDGCYKVLVESSKSYVLALKVRVMKDDEVG
jgi:hypothetical protein